jgi:hypothetical protein
MPSVANPGTNTAPYCYIAVTVGNQAEPWPHPKHGAGVNTPVSKGGSRMYWEARLTPITVWQVV